MPTQIKTPGCPTGGRVPGCRFVATATGGPHGQVQLAPGASGHLGWVSRMRNRRLSPQGSPTADHTPWGYPWKMYSLVTTFADVSQEDRTPGQTNAGLVQGA